MARQVYVHTYVSANSWAINWAGVDAYAEKPFVRITYVHVNHRIINNGGCMGLTWRWVHTWDLYGKGEDEVNDCKPALVHVHVPTCCTVHTCLLMQY